MRGGISARSGSRRALGGHARSPPQRPASSCAVARSSGKSPITDGASSLWWLGAVRDECKDVDRQYEKTEDDLKALQSVGQIIGEVLKQLDEERYIVKASSGPRYVVGCRNKVDKALLKATARVALDMTTLTIMRLLPREVRRSPQPQRNAQLVLTRARIIRWIRWCITC
eukprot:COSAG04_NODE_12_length_42844_cov_6.769213_9_plen_170_part_00